MEFPPSADLPIRTVQPADISPDGTGPNGTAAERAVDVQPNNQNTPLVKSRSIPDTNAIITLTKTRTTTV